MAPGEFSPIQISARITKSGNILGPDLMKGDCKVHIEMPTKPLIGDVIELAVAREQGVILQFELQATKGHGRIIPLGLIRQALRESIEAAVQHIRDKVDVEYVQTIQDVLRAALVSNKT